MEAKEIKKIEYVQSRLMILGKFKNLADIDFQMKNWIDPKYKHSFSDCIALYAFDNLIGWGYLHKKAYEHIGLDIYDEEEADTIQEYCQWFRDLYVDEIEEGEPDEAYYKHPEWPNVIEGALKVRKVMARKNYENGFWKQFDEENGDEHDENNKHHLQLADEEYLD